MSAKKRVIKDHPMRGKKSLSQSAYERHARKPARKPKVAYATMEQLERYVNSLDAECKDLRAYNEDLESKVAGLTLRCDAIASNLINTKALLDKEIERANENIRALAVKTHDQLQAIRAGEIALSVLRR